MKLEPLSPLRNAGAHGALLAMIVSIGVGRAEENELRYRVKTIPIPVLEDPEINDKGQVSGQLGDGIVYYLPEADYGFEPGLYPREAPAPRVYGMNNTGLICGPLYLNKNDVLSNLAPFFPVAVNDDDSLIGQVNSPSVDWAVLVGDGRIFRAQEILPSTPPTPTATIVYAFYDINNESFILTRRLDTDGINRSASYFLLHLVEGGTLDPLPAVSGGGGYTGLNDKNQIVGYVNTTDVATRPAFLYLPSADYGLGAGFHDIGTTTDFTSPVKITNGGVVFFGGGFIDNRSYTNRIWHAGQTFSIQNRLAAGTGAVTVAKIHSVSDEGLVLATGTLDGGATSLLQFTPFYGQDLVVNVTGDESDANPLDNVVDVDLDEPGFQITLRAAIEAANAIPGADTITFDIDDQSAGALPSGGGAGLPEALPSSGPPQIIPMTALPMITDEVEIDGTSQPGAGRVWLRGTTGGPPDGLSVASAKGVFSGLVLTGFTGAAIGIDGGTDHEVKDCLIGTDESGSTGMGNGIGIRLKNALGTTIGGTDEADLNVISANAFALDIRKSNSVSVLANMIGTAPDGTTPMPNTDTGIFAQEVVNTVMGTGEMATPLNAKTGIFLKDCVSPDGQPSVTVRGINFNGDAAGVQALGNTMEVGLRTVNCKRVCVGGGEPGSTMAETMAKLNAFVGITGNAIEVEDSDFFEMLGNLIGVPRHGTGRFPISGIGALFRNSSGMRVGTPAFASPINARVGMKFSGINIGSNGIGALVQGINFNGDSAGMEKLGDTMEAGLCADTTDGLCVGGGTPGSTMAELMAGLNSFVGINGNAIEIDRCTNPEILANLWGVLRHGVNPFSITGTGLLATNSSGMRVGTPAFASPINARVGMKFSGINIGSNGIGALVQGINFNGDSAGMEKLGDTMEAGLCADTTDGLCVGGGTPGSTMAELMAGLNSFVGINGNAIEIDRCINPEILANLWGVLRHGVNPFSITGTGLLATNSSGMRVGTPAFASPLNARVGMKFSGINIGSNGIGALVQGINFNGDSAGMEKLGDTMEAGLCADNSQGVTVGGELPGMANSLTGIMGNGIEMVGMMNSSIVGNRMGVAADGMTPLPNLGDNIFVGLGDGLLSIFKNRIQSAGGAGVRVAGDMGNTVIRQNRMIGNQKAIDRAIHDAFISAIGAMYGSTSVQGSVSGLPSETLIMDFYAYDPMAPTPEADLYIGSTTVNLDSGGFGTYAELFPTTAPRGWMITSTATNGTQGTSELGPSSVIAPALDTDHDGFPDSYELRYPMCFDPDVPHPADADCDRDGRSDREEYLAGTDPTRGDSITSDPPLVSESGVMVAIDAIAGRRYTMERFDMKGQWLPAGSRYIPLPGRAEFMDPNPPAASALYRFRIEVE